jgi:hypothetical protein
VIISRYTGRETVQYYGVSVSDAIETYEMIKKSHTTMKQFKLQMRKFKPVVMMESE